MPTAIKQFRTYEEQVDLLTSRGMDVGGRGAALEQLRKVNYYRLSGYSYPFRILDGDSRQDPFYPGTTLDNVTSLYRFDANLRAAAFAALSAIELTVRALLGHALDATVSPRTS